MRADIALLPDPRAVHLARGLLHEMCQLLGLEDLAGTAALLTTETVTNAVVHAHTARVLLTVLANTRSVQVSVSDEDTVMPELRHPKPDEAGGRGLLLLSRLAQRWGVRQRDRGKTVWFDLRHELPSCPGSSRSQSLREACRTDLERRQALS